MSIPSSLKSSNIDGPKKLREWFLRAVLPTWSYYGIDRVHGGFYEGLYPDYSPTSEPRRVRVTARQIYMFAVGQQLGWDGPGQEMVRHGLNYLYRNHLTASGRVIASCSAEGTTLDYHQRLYDVAFVLLALAKSQARDEQATASARMAKIIAVRLRSKQKHRLGGYVDMPNPRIQSANAHMHLFEAFLTWAEHDRAERHFWMDLASELAELCLNRLIQDRYHGLIPEYYDSDWKPIVQKGGLRFESGHQFEWSWLLSLWSKLSNRDQPISALKNLCLMSEQHGVDHERGLVIQEFDEHLQIVDPTARFWQQTERLKAWHAMQQLEASSLSQSCKQGAFNAIIDFIASASHGLWDDEIRVDSPIRGLPSKASTGYHVACALQSIQQPCL